ncbi:hypothetical protein Tco_1363470 [Tanacetum coccineum]
MTKVIKEEFENLGFLEINDDSFACNTQLGTLYDEFNRLSRIDNDLFTYEIEVPKPCLCDKQTSNLTHNDLKEYEWKMSYEECEKIYAKDVIFINKRLVRLVDVTEEQWLDLKYGNHITMDENVKKWVISTWLIRSYKLQFEEYLEIKKQRDTYARDVNMEYDPSNLVFAKWLASKFYNHLDMGWYTKNALWIYWARDVHTKDIDGFKTHEEYKDDWIYEWNEDVPWMHEKPWKEDGYCNGGNFPGAYIVGNTLRYQDLKWYEALKDVKLKDEALKNKAIMEGIINEDDESNNKV